MAFGYRHTLERRKNGRRLVRLPDIPEALTEGETEEEARELGMPEDSVRRLLDLRHSSHLWAIDEALAKMRSELSIDLPRVKGRKTAA